MLDSPSPKLHWWSNPVAYVSREDAHGQGERQARGRRERSTSPLDRSHKSRPSQDRATTASRNDEVSGLYFCLLEMIM